MAAPIRVHEASLEYAQGAHHQAYRILHIAFTVVPLLAGLDKFFELMVNWGQYLSPVIARILPFDSHYFMAGVGAIEIFAGILVALRPQIGGYVVAFWLWAVIVNLLSLQGYYDVALRDFGLSLGALALAKLAEEEREPAADERTRDE